MLSFNDVACRRDGKLLFQEISCVIHAGQKVGLTGANGCGKSSLFAMIRGELEPDTGSIHRQQHVGITHVAQETPASDASALDYVMDGDQKIRALQQAIDQCGDEQGERLASLLADYEQAGGYTLQSRAGALLHGLGFAIHTHQNSVTSFSGGWRMRLNLAQALISPNELLMLDEPTNHLDLDAVLWLETWLKQREGTLILISHDREFLDAVTDNTLHIAQGRGDLVSGNYSAFERWQAARLQNQQALHEKTQARRKELQAFVDRFRAKATKARQAQSRLKMLERLGDTEAVRLQSPFTFSFRVPPDKPSPLVVLDRAELRYDDGPPILKDVRFTVQSGDRVGLLGVNGAGKSTLIKALTGALPLTAGTRTPAQKLAIGYFAQHQVDQLRDDHSPLQALLAHDPTLSEQQARTYLGGFGFHGEQTLQTAATLSGGERARLALALIVQSEPNLLLLDEPTNHLDIAMRQALADALVAFEGALLVISHDRTMLRSVVDELWLVADQQLQPFDDDLDGYARWLAQRRAQEAQRHSADALIPNEAHYSDAGDNHQSVQNVTHTASNKAVTESDRRAQKRIEAQRRARLAPLNKAVTRCEKQLDKASEALDVIRGRLGDESLYNDDSKARLTDLLNAEAEARHALEAAEEQLLLSMEALETAQANEDETT